MKRVFCILLSFLCVCHMTFGIAAAVTETDVPRMGDVNLDGQYTAVDCLWVLQYCVGKREFTQQQLSIADMSYAFYKTEDHKGIDVRDALIILQRACFHGPFKPVWPWEGQ